MFSKFLIILIVPIIIPLSHDRHEDVDYEEFLQKLFELAVKHVETIPNKPTEVDMFDFDSNYQEEWDDEDDWDDEEF